MKWVIIYGTKTEKYFKEIKAENKEEAENFAYMESVRVFLKDKNITALDDADRMNEELEYKTKKIA